MYKEMGRNGCTYISKVEVKHQNRENVTIWILILGNAAELRIVVF